MEYIKKELNKILPLALLFGAIGGVLLIVVSNLLAPNQLTILFTYAVLIGSSVYILNKIRFKNEVKGSILYGYCVYAVMTIIAYLDMIMNVDPNFINPIFENITFFIGLFAAVVIISAGIVVMFKRKLIS